MRKIINDPVHGFITIDDEFIYQLISHPSFQRLRRIKQMALAYLVYPGAVHTRLHHALGAYHLMCNAVAELKSKGHEISKEEELAVKIAILLHDIGHGPFSHALEHNIVNIHHEKISLAIMEELNSQWHGKLDMAIAIFKNMYPKKFLHQLISSQLDVDRLDYLARDSYFTGVSEGVIGYDRIIKMFDIVDQELVVEEKGIHSVEKFIVARRLMYWQVYLHKTVLSSEILLGKVLQRAKELFRTGKTIFATPALAYFLQETRNENDAYLASYLALDDSDIITSVKMWATSDDKILSDLANRILNRKLFKIKFYKAEEKHLVIESRNAIIKKQGLSEAAADYYFHAGESSNLFYSHTDAAIKIKTKNAQIIPISEVENALIPNGVQEQVKKYYFCYAEE